MPIYRKVIIRWNKWKSQLKTWFIYGWYRRVSKATEEDCIAHYLKVNVINILQ